MKKLLLSVLIVCFFISCGGNKKPQTIEFQLGWAVDSSRGQAIQLIVDNYNALNKDGITVQTISGDKIDTARLLTQIASGDSPDVMTLNYSTLKAFSAEKILKQITGFDSMLKKAYPENVLSKVMYEGRIYGLPWIGHSINIVYNEELLKKAGLSEAPKTWDELIEYTKIIKDKTGVDGLAIGASQHYDTVWMSMPVLYAYGSKILEGEIGSGNERIKLTDDVSINAISKLQELYNQYKSTPVANGGKVMEDFRAQKAAMEFQGPWGVTDIWQNGRPFTAIAAIMPDGPAGRFADIGIEALVIPDKKMDKAKEEAVNKFLTYMLSSEAQTMIMDGEKSAKDGNFYPFRVPVRQDLDITPFFAKYPELVVFSEGIKYAADTAPAPYWNKVGNEVWAPVMNELAINRITPKEAAARIEKEGNAIIESFYKQQGK